MSIGCGGGRPCAPDPEQAGSTKPISQASGVILPRFEASASAAHGADRLSRQVTEGLAARAASPLFCHPSFPASAFRGNDEIIAASAMSTPPPGQASPPRPSTDALVSPRPAYGLFTGLWWYQPRRRRAELTNGKRNDFPLAGLLLPCAPRLHDVRRSAVPAGRKRWCAGHGCASG